MSIFNLNVDVFEVSNRASKIDQIKNVLSGLDFKMANPSRKSFYIGQNVGIMKRHKEYWNIFRTQYRDYGRAQNNSKIYLKLPSIFFLLNALFNGPKMLPDYIVKLRK
jgi:hypothetical protein